MSDDDERCSKLAGSGDHLSDVPDGSCDESSGMLELGLDDSDVNMDIPRRRSRKRWFSRGEPHSCISTSDPSDGVTSSREYFSSLGNYYRNALLITLSIATVGSIVWLGLRVNQLNRASLQISQQNQSSVQMSEQKSHEKNKENFIETVLRHPLEGPFDPAPIRAKCDRTHFRPGLIWHCAHITPGVANAANELLNCVRFALEAGAITLIVPGIQLRYDDLKNLGWHDPTDMAYPISYLFDADHLVESWKKACPQMNVFLWHRHITDALPGSMPVVLVPDQISNFERSWNVVVNSSLWRDRFDELVAVHPILKDVTAENPVRVSQVTVLMQWNRESDPPAFARQFSRILAFPMQSRRLAAAALWRLGRKIGKPIALVPPELDAGPARLVRPGFLGVHLRVEADFGDSTYPAQRDSIFDQAQRLGSRNIFVGSGSVEYQDVMRKEALGRAIQLHSKRDLLSPEELVELDTLTFDQQATVDFEILMRAEFLTGVNPSTFSWWLALRRNLLPEAGPYTGRQGKADTGFEDNVTKIMAWHKSTIFDERGIWP